MENEELRHTIHNFIKFEGRSLDRNHKRTHRPTPYTFSSLGSSMTFAGSVFSISSKATAGSVSSTSSKSASLSPTEIGNKIIITSKHQRAISRTISQRQESNGSRNKGKRCFDQGK
ncbi:hypothetical protein EAF04_005071 [Stromatinia cepivora]|nr:hypothetical protein EAF04_005071 [Stromatinia cepivora]